MMRACHDCCSLLFLAMGIVCFQNSTTLAQDADFAGADIVVDRSGSNATALERADVAYRENQLEDALDLYKEALKTQPSSAHARAKILEIESILRTPGTKTSNTVQAGSESSNSEPAPDAVQPTADGKGGATEYTSKMPLTVAELKKLRKNQLGQPEFRAAWVTRFDWVSQDPGQSKSNIVRIMQDAKNLGINAVIFQVRCEAATMYPSKLEPWSRLLGGQDPGYDPLQFAIDEAHKRGIELHAYINPCPVSDERNGPSNPASVWFKHCLPDSEPNWLVYRGGKPADFNEYWWLNPNLPEVQTYIRQVVVDLVSRYNVDGVHYDRIRFPSSDVSDDPWSQARFQHEGNPMGLSYNEWQCDNIVRMLTDIYGCIQAIRPKTKVSASVWGIHDKTKMPQGSGVNDRAHSYSWTSSGLQDYHQDSIAFINRGAVDALVPMIYWDMGGNKPDFDELCAYFHRNVKNGRHIYAGQKVFTGSEMLRQVVAARLIGAEGMCPFTLENVYKKGLETFYKANIYPANVPTPEMPWKSSPTKGIVLIAVRNAGGAAVMDAHIKMTGTDYIWLSSADGFCAIIDAEPGTGKRLEVEKEGVGKTDVQLPEIVPGKPLTIKVSLQ